MTSSAIFSYAVRREPFFPENQKLSIEESCSDESRDIVSMGKTDTIIDAIDSQVEDARKSIFSTINFIKNANDALEQSNRVIEKLTNEVKEKEGFIQELMGIISQDNKTILNLKKELVNKNNYIKILQAEGRKDPSKRVP
jgi:hypothetical protein